MGDNGLISGLSELHLMMQFQQLTNSGKKQIVFLFMLLIT